MKQRKISDYALIGNCRAAALVSKSGSIDWCCLPDFDSPSVFAALLDSDDGGHFIISPADPFTSDQKYLQDTNVVQARFITTSGEAELSDMFTAMTEHEKRAALFPDHEILRIVEGLRGTVKMQLEYVPQPLYGKNHPQLKDRGKFGIHLHWRENNLCLLSTLDPEKIKVSDGKKAVAEFNLNAGERVIFSLSYSNQSPSTLPELAETGFGRFASTVSFWRAWIGKCEYDGVYAAEVRRSALALKLLTHAASGAIIAAPTTSLPEWIGGRRNWDYRYCWLRDASFTTRVLIKLGFDEEVHAYMHWILHATRLTRPRLQTVYSVYGRSKLGENILEHLSGYRGSRPVRTGNKADEQLQLDVYGEVLDAIHTYSKLVSKFDRDSTKFIIGLGNVICRSWKETDNGIWEIRSRRIHHTHSKVMCWVGLDRLISLCRKYQWTDAPLEKFAATARLIYDHVTQSGYSDELQAYTRELGGSDVDASALTFSLVGFEKYSSPRMVSTVNQISRHLKKNDLLYRYLGIDDGADGNEGSFGICNFWLAENLARIGRPEEAITVFEKMLKAASPTGLLSEELDPESGELLGNYPQGFTHIGLINAALTIDEELKKKKLRPNAKHDRVI